MIGIIGIMDEEVIAVKRRMHVARQTEIAGMEFFIGTIDEKEVVVVQCGIGKVNAAVCTQILIDIFKVEYMINTSFAGGLNPELQIADIVVASDLLGDSKEVEDKKKAYFEANQKLLIAAREAAEGLRGNRGVYVGRIASNDEFICSIRLQDDIYTTFTAYCAEMEGTAIAHTCFLNQVPFVAIRTISDKVDPSGEISFEDFVDETTRNASRVVESIVRIL